MSELLAGVAHELNNPLAIVSGHAALLRQTAGNQTVVARAEKIAQAAERCARLMRNFLSLARHYPSERGEVDVNRMITHVHELLGYQLRVDNVEIVFDLAEDLPIIWADPHQLDQVMVNLIGNAHHAMRLRTGPRRLTLATKFERQEHQVRLQVADTGPGIPSEIQGRIFEPFFTTKPPGEGTGLGLSLCRSILEEHGGAIRVESSPGGGAKFIVTLPIGEPREVAPQAALAEPLAQITGKVVLVVDDEPEMANLLAEMLTSDGHQVEIAANGNEALAKSRQRAYDLIFSDIRMPELDGPGFYQQLTQQHPELRGRFVFVTGDTLGHETRAFLERVGAPGLHKPFTPEEVRQVAQRLLRST
jgi:two-component system NtrC family sensor kinase